MRCLVAIVVGVAAGAVHAPTASAQAEAPRVFHAPTAWLEPRASGHGSAGITHRGSAMLAVTAGLGNLADVDLTVDDRLVACTACDEDDRETTSIRHGSAQFKLGVGNGVVWTRPAAIAVGFRKTFRAEATGRSARIGELFAVASGHLGPVTLHGGAAAWRADYGSASDAELELAVRGFGGIEYRPPAYPKTTLLGDMQWVPELGDDIELRWVAAWGIRYQALAWGSIELGVRHRESEAIGDATVFVRVNGRRP